jgi:formate C-acetyltransferase
MSKGESLEQARDYGVIGCVEPGSNGRSYGHSAAILLNLISVLELALFNGKHRHTGQTLISKETGDPGDFSTFDEFKVAFEEQVRWMVNLTTDLNNTFGTVYQDLQPTPILSALFEGPMEKGKCLEQGGATINSSGATIIGFADVADSLTAIQKVVFEDGVPFAEFLDAIRDDFRDHDVIYKKVLEAPKYGNDNEMADSNAIWVAELMDKVFGEKENYRGGRYRVGYWTMTNHAGFGRLMGATPNGRRDGENFTSGITPVSGVTPSLTAALSSVAGLPAKYLSSGIALNLKYTREENMLENFVSSVKGYFDDNNETRDGGMEIQFNIRDRDTFLKVMNNPEAKEAKELLVRVSGYTAYFKDLNPQMQKEIIDRTEYSLSTGSMIPHDLLPLPERSE